MSSACCSFCRHANPIGAKFCNACGCILRLKPCEQCDAINDLNAPNCHQCGADLFDLTAPKHASAGTRALVASSPSVVGSDTVTAEPNTFQNELTNDSASLSAVRLDPFWRESWVVAGSRPPVLPATPARQDDVLAKHSAVVFGSALWVKCRRQATLATALVIAAGVAGFYGYEQSNPIDASIHKQSVGSIAIGTASIGSLPREVRSEPSTPTVSDQHERPGSPMGTPNVELDDTAAVRQPTPAEPRAKRGERAKHTGSRNSVRPAAELNASIRRPAPREVIPQVSIPDPVSYPSTTGPCTSSVAALGLCSMDSVSGGH